MPDRTRSLLDAALDDAYRARAFYTAIQVRFARVHPFSDIVRCEERRITDLRRLYDQLALDPPDDPHLGTVSTPRTLVEACQLALEAEHRSIALYDRLCALARPPALASALRVLRDQNRQRRLRAFERCIRSEPQEPAAPLPLPPVRAVLSWRPADA